MTTKQKIIQFSCGDEFHSNLEEWYRRYVGSLCCLDEEEALLKDKFNKASLEEKIHEKLSEVPVSKGYFPGCQRFLDEWPEIIKRVLELKPDDPSEMGKLYQQHYYKNTLELEAGYRNACRLCTLFVQHSISIDNSLEKPSLHKVWLLPTNTLYCVNNSDQQLFTLGKEAKSLTEGGALSKLNFARKWLNACLETHEICKLTKDRQLPTRLIVLESTPIRLVKASTFTTKPHYAALSHCWGTKNFFKLQEAFLAEFMIAIPEDKLTKTFQDAIYITRYLGL
ncbi:hypothetical protein G7Y89_g3419 [Cudoniella acicularis]|uniref:Heterokaryon incompatibility domain-containing protein n=1 Tax=Cudoniella acicularis TaxID=354080 RepID=A0A8H4W572_9HELO|nr:hypothetical protein G7Y89_g3419 [Cudoniella acicularis]